MYNKKDISKKKIAEIPEYCNQQEELKEINEMQR